MGLRCLDSRPYSGHGGQYELCGTSGNGETGQVMIWLGSVLGVVELK
jgi:hypothetical protein